MSRAGAEMRAGLRCLQALALACLLGGASLLCTNWAHAASEPQVKDIPTRPGVTQRYLLLEPEGKPRAAVILMAGGHGGLNIYRNGSFGWGEGNFLVRTRAQFAQQGLVVAVVDAPSDRQSRPWLNGFRQGPEHAEDMAVLIAALRKEYQVPVWLVGTSRGTQSAAAIAARRAPAEGGPDGVVLTSTILVTRSADDRPVPQFPLERIGVPVLVVHHRDDGCSYCPASMVPTLMDKLTHTPRKQAIIVEGGIDQGDPCAAAGHHGFRNIEQHVVTTISNWITTP